MSPRYRLAVEGPGGTLRLDVCAPDAVEATRALFPRALAAEEDEGPDFTLDRGDGGYELRTAEGVWRAPSLASILTRLELSVAEESVRRSGMVPVHAGGSVVAGRAVLLAGPSGSGKSSLTAGLAFRGHATLGDDVVLLGAGGRAHPVRRLLKVEEPARTLLGLPEGEPRLRALWPEAWFFEPEDLGSRWAEPAPVRAIAFLSRADAGTRLEDLGGPDALPELLGGVLTPERISNAAFDAAAAALSEARCLRLTYADAPSALRALLSALG